MRFIITMLFMVLAIGSPAQALPVWDGGSGGGTDTNASTICSGDQSLRGDGSCTIPAGGAAGGTDEIQFNNGSTLDGDSNFTWDGSLDITGAVDIIGAVTATSFTSANVPGSNGIAMFFNTSLSSTPDVGKILLGPVGALGTNKLWMKDSDADLFEIVSYNSDGALNDCLAGSKKDTATFPFNWCFKENGNLQTGDIREVWVTGTDDSAVEQSYRGIREMLTITETDEGAETYNFDWRFGHNGNIAETRWEVATATGFHFYGSSDAGATSGIYIHDDGGDAANSVWLKYPATGSGDYTVELPEIGGLIALSDVLESQGAFRVLSDDLSQAVTLNAELLSAPRTIQYPDLAGTMVVSPVPIVETLQSPTTLVAADMVGQIYVATHVTSVNWDLATAAQGLNACFINQTGGLMDIDPGNGSDFMWLPGTGILDGGDKLTAQQGDTVCVLAVDDTNWHVMGGSATLSDGGP